MRSISIFLLLFFLGACHEKTEVNVSFYHWETNVNLTASETDYLDETNVDNLYIKFFDLKVLGSGRVGPVALVDFTTLPKQAVIPVIYISTAVFQQVDSTQIKLLATRTLDKVKQLNENRPFLELQIDCDWMPSIKDRYFYFLSCLKQEMDETKLSCTIRLYQYKYPDITGVPPVDEGVLMYYNMGKIRDYAETNSILNNEVGKAYLGFGDYPLPLNFALPYFSWTLRFHYGEFIQIMPQLGLAELEDTALFEKQENQYYQIKKDTFLDGSYLRFGDEFRYESCTENELIRAAKLLAPEKNQAITTLIFYDLKPAITYEKDKINRVYTAFK